MLRQTQERWPCRAVLVLLCLYKTSWHSAIIKNHQNMLFVNTIGTCLCKRHRDVPFLSCNVILSISISETRAQKEIHKFIYKQWKQVGPKLELWSKTLITLSGFRDPASRVGVVRSRLLLMLVFTHQRMLMRVVFMYWKILKTKKRLSR